ncbi:MAG TPA: di-heme oxidoredictase family protein, partial [Chloroflexota bacterium]|nr:di-heme oxidoredictase family protein [Chloroflexota bacterium]
EEGTGASTFMTRALWGVGSTAPYMHNGSATTLTEAILLHGGQASFSRMNFLTLGPDSQADLINYLNEHVLFKVE